MSNILFFISWWFLPSDVICVARYLNELACFMVFSLILISHFGIDVFLVIIIDSLFLLFSSSPLFSLSSTTLLKSSCNFSSESAINTVSSAYLMLLMLCPPIFKPSISSICLMIISLYREKRSGDRTHPCLTPRLIFWKLLVSS